MPANDSTCGHCHQYPAEIHVSQVIGPLVIAEHALCPACAQAAAPADPRVVPLLGPIDFTVLRTSLVQGARGADPEQLRLAARLLVDVATRHDQALPADIRRALDGYAAP